MRTSGVSSDPIYYIPAIVGAVAIVMLLGGPAAFLTAVEHLFRGFFSVLRDWGQALTG